jgi:hypothetical protein
MGQPTGFEGEQGCFCGEPEGAVKTRAEALVCLAKPRDGVGYQIGYLRLRLARVGQGVNVGVKVFS